MDFTPWNWVELAGLAIGGLVFYFKNDAKVNSHMVDTEKALMKWAEDRFVPRVELQLTLNGLNRRLDDLSERQDERHEQNTKKMDAILGAVNRINRPH